MRIYIELNGRGGPCTRPYTDNISYTHRPVPSRTLQKYYLKCPIERVPFTCHLVKSSRYTRSNYIRSCFREIFYLFFDVYLGQLLARIMLRIWGRYNYTTLTESWTLFQQYSEITKKSDQTNEFTNAGK